MAPAGSSRQTRKFSARSSSLADPEPASSGEAASRLRRASTTARARSNSEGDARVASEASPSCGGSRSVHEAGIRDRLPSGRISSNSRLRCRCIQPRRVRDWPSKGWWWRVTRTVGGKPSRWVVCGPFFRRHRPRMDAEVSPTPDRGPSGTAPSQTMAPGRGARRGSETGTGVGYAARGKCYPSHAKGNFEFEVRLRIDRGNWSRRKK